MISLQKFWKYSSVVSVLLLLSAPITNDKGTTTYDKIVYLKHCVFSTALVDNPTQQLLLVPCWKLPKLYGDNSIYKGCLEGHNILFYQIWPEVTDIVHEALIQFDVLWDWRLGKYLVSNLRPGFRHMHKNWTRLFGNYRKDTDQYYHNLLQLDLYRKFYDEH